MDDNDKATTEVRSDKTIWTFFHDGMRPEHARHTTFSRMLREYGYNDIIFAASTIHNSDKNLRRYGELYHSEEYNSVPFVIVETRSYYGNGKSRILNMLDYYRNVQKTAKRFVAPDIIIATSPQPLACVAAIRVARILGVPCICEVRDLWPESLVEYGYLKRNTLLACALYRGERWIYEKADALVFTAEGGSDYICERGWDTKNGGKIDLAKVHYINNGVNIATFDANANDSILQDADLDNPDIFKVVYTGSVRKANNIGKLLDVAQLVKEQCPGIRFLVWGDGDELSTLQERSVKDGLDNVVFKGRVEKHYIPSILKRGDVNLQNVEFNSLTKYGTSNNKLFEYLAAGKPILAVGASKYSIVGASQAGIETEEGSPEEVASAIIAMRNLSAEERESMGKNARRAAKQYDSSVLTGRLSTIVGELIKK